MAAEKLFIVLAVSTNSEKPGATHVWGRSAVPSEGRWLKVEAGHSRALDSEHNRVLVMTSEEACKVRDVFSLYDLSDRVAVIARLEIHNGA
jgi:hypothetical protein